MKTNYRKIFRIVVLAAGGLLIGCAEEQPQPVRYQTTRTSTVTTTTTTTSRVVAATNAAPSH
ncbi:MAG TPA: hypothetical protein VLT36_16125 [Candidatus Dormibacteraeota bacterium]|nr:hypothetical protein [Candidatus Dormibacteraeota bacterium]